MATVAVTAPSDMPEGYEFEATVNGEAKTIIVPTGGVKEGETFNGVVKDGTIPPASEKMPAGVKTGAWKHGICFCADFCFCKAVWWLSWCATGLSLAQVQQRLKFDWWGQPASGSESNAWKWMLPTFFIFLIAGIFFPLIWYIYSLFVVYLMTVTRFNMRKKLSIPPSGACGCCDGGMGDCCASFWCSCCTVIQMSGQITDIETADTKCCTPTGLSA